MSLPSASFLVPSILEALVACDRYKDITEVVPGEADLYCAQSLKDRAGIVLTGDSDLLIHDLGRGGAVSFFRDIEPVPKDAKGNLRSRVYHPATIADRLRLPKSDGLRALAFELYQGPNKGFGELLSEARVSKAISSQPEEYEAFRKEYVCLLAQPKLSTEINMLHVLKVLDPRVSEYVLQFPFIAEVAGQSLEYNTSDPTPHIFLPFLFDYPLRTNAWEMSRAIRQLAYGLINLISPEDQRKSTVFEHNRQQGKLGGRELQLPETSHIPEACSNIVAVLEQMGARLPPSPTSEMDLWLAVAVYQDIEWTHQNSKPALVQLISQQLLLLEDQSNSEKNLTWDILQFMAQIEGSYHSFRILKQTTNLLTSSRFVNSLPPSVLRLHEKLQLLPSLSSIQDISQTIVTLRRIKATAMSETAHEILGIVLPEVSASPQAIHRQAKKSRKRDRVEASMPVPLKRPNNPFGLLELE
ncbi:uncharacterized protein BP5553_09695 [Venustampulla echinocandica]|uniref:Asteroid domain-containing protein n=1 Tax=Venustampulla echinocandica TaxID=2656787 RepID=A0A370TBS6_9HELO|nr:uncharacterized protein BP5553_09695 [Venustampulla echinocandica]RDL31486.1 hypothetical protein BP5553_09695 [Venustampulla echinocandica]